MVQFKWPKLYGSFALKCSRYLLDVAFNKLPHLRDCGNEPSLQFIFGLRHLNGVSASRTLPTSPSHLKRSPILNKLLSLVPESFGHATAWSLHRKTGTFSVLTLQWPVQACISFPVK